MDTSPTPTPEAAMRHWVDAVVVGLDLCPFARRVVRADHVRYVTTPAATLEALLPVAHEELMELAELRAPEGTTLILAPGFSDFETFLNGVRLIEGLIVDLELEGVIQVAHFHPHYRFAGVPPEATSHYTNRAPVPAYHLLREEEVTAGVAAHPDPAGIPARNIARLAALGEAAIRRLAGLDP